MDATAKSLSPAPLFSARPAGLYVVRFFNRISGGMAGRKIYATGCVYWDGTRLTWVDSEDIEVTQNYEFQNVVGPYVLHGNAAAPDWQI